MDLTVLGFLLEVLGLGRRSPLLNRVFLTRQTLLTSCNRDRNKAESKSSENHAYIPNTPFIP